MKEILDTLKSWAGITSSLGVIVPGFTFFTDNAPPFFPHITLITSALAVAVIVVTAKSKKRVKRKKVVRLLAISFVSVCVYIVAFKYTTYQGDLSDERQQVGAYLFRFSLSEEAKKMLDGKFCPKANTVSEILTCVPGGIEERIHKIWNIFYIILCGMLLLVLSTVSALLWVRSFTLLAKLE